MPVPTDDYRFRHLLFSLPLQYMGGYAVRKQMTPFFSRTSSAEPGDETLALACIWPSEDSTLTPYPEQTVLNTTQESHPRCLHLPEVASFALCLSQLPSNTKSTSASLGMSMSTSCRVIQYTTSNHLLRKIQTIHPTINHFPSILSIVTSPQNTN
ncbi:hypothetical protein WAI453_000132 [Rhynchosporium graminicola]